MRTPFETPALVPVWNLALPDGKRLGEDRIELLRAIATTGSLLAAAERCGISYRTAWSRVKELNAGSAQPLVLSAQGGADGGATRLSAEALRLVTLHQEANRLFRRTAADHGLSADELHPLESFQRKLSMKTSVRNQYAGQIEEVRRGKVDAAITLLLDGGTRIQSRITLASCDALQLSPGMDAWALIKANWVEIATGPRPADFDGRNALRAIVRSIRHGLRTEEVTLSLEGSQTIAAVVATESVRPLALAKGSPAWVLFQAQNVILAVN